MITIKNQYQCKWDYKNLNDLTKRLVELNQNGNIRDRYRDLFLSNLSNKTNIEKELNRVLASIEDLNLEHVISNLVGVSNDDLTDSLLTELNSDLNRIKQKHEKNFNFIFPVNIISKKCIDDFERIHGTTFEDLINMFGIELVDSNDYKFYKTELLVGKYKDSKRCISELMCDLLDSNKYRGLLLEINITARGLGFANKKALRKIQIFLGFLTLIKHYLDNPKSYYSRFNKDRKLEITNISSENYFVLENKIELIHPFYYVINLKGNKESLGSYWQIKRDEIIHEVLELPTEKIDSCHYIIYEILKIYEDNEINKNLKEILEESLILYYHASKEKMLDYSFLKFWMISELIIKKAESTSDKTVASIMARVIKSNVRLPTEKFLEEEIHFLQQKRNALVHEGKLENISQNDRNLSKLIAESVLRLFIEWIPEIGQIHGFSFVLKNLRQSYDNLNQYSEILKKIQTPNEYTIKLALNILKNNGYNFEHSGFKNELKLLSGEQNETIVSNIEKGLIEFEWIYLEDNFIKPTNKMLSKYDLITQFLISTSIHT